MGKHEIRDILHGFISFDDWERDVINHEVFQRLRRIKQLSLTEMIYPGANHTRFEHSLGVMHLATLFYNRILDKRENFLQQELRFDDSGIKRDRRIIRFAALLHDVGHAPFSHAGEDLMPFIQDNPPLGRYSHEDYSIAIIKAFFKDVIENHQDNANYDIKVEDITALLGDKTVRAKRGHLWKNLISGQLDADRADYLLRDSLHLGIRYGFYDMDRLINTMSVANDEENSGANLVIEEGGWHVAESLVIARYQMFSQVYFHKTRRAYDHHIDGALKEILTNTGDKTGFFPPPSNADSLQQYIDFDDWKMLGMFKEEFGGLDKDIILRRQHDRCIHQTNEVPNDDELDNFEELSKIFASDISFNDSSEKSWYKTGKEDILVLSNDGKEKLTPLSQRSSIVKAMQPIKQKRLYVRHDMKESINEKIQKYNEGKCGN